jgi:alpha-1,2-mannosyltransferase
MSTADFDASTAGSSRRRRTAARAVVAVLTFGVLASGLYFAGKSGTNAGVYSNDFNVYYRAAREVLAGGAPYQNSLGEWTPYLYPPLLAEMLTPVALLPLPVAAYIWYLISAASILGSIWMLSVLAGDSKTGPIEPTDRELVLAALAVVVALRFVLDTFNLGQVNNVGAALAVAHVFFYRREKKALSAIALVLAISIKLTPALLLVYHFAKLRMKFAAACATLLAAVSIASFLPFGSPVTALQAFVSRTIKNEQGYNLADAGNQALRGAIERSSKNANESTDTDTANSRKPADLSTLLISIVFLTLAIAAARSAGSEMSGIAPFFCCMVLLSPLSWKAHFVILILPLANLLFRTDTSARPRFLVVATSIAAFALFNLTSPHVVGIAAAEWADCHSLVFGGGLIVFTASLVAAMARKFGKQPYVC